MQTKPEQMEDNSQNTQNTKENLAWKQKKHTT